MSGRLGVQHQMPLHSSTITPARHRAFTAGVGSYGQRVTGGQKLRRATPNTVKMPLHSPHCHPCPPLHLFLTLIAGMGLNG